MKQSEKLPSLSQQEPKNSIFTMKIEYGIGTKEDPALKYASELGNMIGNTDYTFNALKEELKK